MKYFSNMGVFHWAGLSPGSTPAFDLRRELEFLDSYHHAFRWLPFLLSNGNTANAQSPAYPSALELEMYGDDFFKAFRRGQCQHSPRHEAGRLKIAIDNHIYLCSCERVAEKGILGAVSAPPPSTAPNPARLAALAPFLGPRRKVALR